MTSTGDLYLDRNQEVWRRVHDGSLVRLTLGGYISPAVPEDRVEADFGPLRELVPIESRGTVTDNELDGYAECCGKCGPGLCYVDQMTGEADEGWRR